MKAHVASTDANHKTGTTDITEIAQELWSYLTGAGATVDYSFEYMLVEVPKTTGPDAQRATWKLNGILRIKTTRPRQPRRRAARAARPSRQMDCGAAP